jgi:hypothetical protein
MINYLLYFSEENDKCIRRFDENEKNSLKQINFLQDKYNEIVKRYENLEFEKNTIELELKELRSVDSSRDKLIHKFNRNEEETEKMIQGWLIFFFFFYQFSYVL